MSVEKQIISLFAALNGYLDRFEDNVDKISDFINNLYNYALKSYLFSPHLYMLRFSEYFKSYDYSSLNFLLEYYANYIYKN